MHWTMQERPICFGWLVRDIPVDARPEFASLLVRGAVA